MPIIRTVLALIFIVFLLLRSGCTTASERSKSDQCYTWVKTFFRMPLKEQLTQFGSYDVESQYDIFICGNQVVHPPATYLAGPFAMEGESVVHFLKTKLLQAKDDQTIRDVILVFTEMSRRKTYDVARNSDLMVLITDSVARIKDDDWRQIVAEEIRSAFGMGH